MTLQSTDAFLPLTSATTGDKNRDFRVTVIPQAESVPGFKNLTQIGAAETANAAAGSGKNCEPRLSLQRDGDRIASIRVQCSCGQVMDLACVYDEAMKTK
jgi:hypothetical protein